MRPDGRKKLMPEAARVVIEHLRSGVPSPEVAEALSTARERLIAVLEADMERVADGRATRNHQVMTANYGDGKSHVLNALWLRARRRRWLVSMVTFSREAPLDQTERVYRKVAARTYMPGVERPGLGPLLDALAERPEVTQRLLREVERNLHPKVALALAARLEGRGDPVTVDEERHGYRHSVSDIRRAYQERTGKRPPKVERYLVGEHAFDYFRLVDAMVRALELPGWLLLFDEVEMIGNLGRMGRARSYAFMGRMTDPKTLPSTYSVWMVSSNFRPRVIEQLEEPARLPAWLTERGREPLAQEVVRPLDDLVRAQGLPPLTSEDLREMFGAIVEVHAAALHWQPPLDGIALLDRIRAQVPERDAKVRQLVRGAVQYLDLMQQYGKEPRIRLHSVGEAPITPEDDELPAGTAVVRDWPDD